MDDMPAPPTSPRLTIKEFLKRRMRPTDRFKRHPLIESLWILWVSVFVVFMGYSGYLLYIEHVTPSWFRPLALVLLGLFMAVVVLGGVTQLKDAQQLQREAEARSKAEHEAFMQRLARMEHDERLDTPSS